MRKTFNASASMDSAMERFSELMIQKLETCAASEWKKPWFTEGLETPRNLSGRYYNGMNSVMLMMQAEKEKYPLSVWGTFNRFTSFNYAKTENGVVPLRDKEGNELPRVMVNKGEKSFPVALTCFICVHKETGEKIAYDEYRQLSPEAQALYNCFPRMMIYHVFNVAQTNLVTARPEIYARLKSGHFEEPSWQMNIGEIDAMLENQSWLCPIEHQYGDKCYYSISRDVIVTPKKEQFKDAESFYGNLLHEMAHSTGAESRCNRLDQKNWSDKKYAQEELVAELTAAFVLARLGITKNLKSDSLPYLKSWLDNLHESPEFIRVVLSDVKKASSMIEQALQ